MCASPGLLSHVSLCDLTRRRHLCSIWWHTLRNGAAHLASDERATLASHPPKIGRDDGMTDVDSQDGVPLVLGVR